MNLALRSEILKLSPELTVRITQLPAGVGLPVYTRLLSLAARHIGPDAVTQLTAEGAETKLAELLAKGLVGAVAAPDFASNLDALIAAFAPQTVVLEDGKEHNLTNVFDIVFSGQYNLLLKWIAGCVKLNYGSSFLG